MSERGRKGEQLVYGPVQIVGHMYGGQQQPESFSYSTRTPWAGSDRREEIPGCLSGWISSSDTDPTHVALKSVIDKEDEMRRYE